MHRRKAYTHKTRIFERLCEKKRYMGKSETTPSNKTNKCTRGRLTHKTQMFKRLCKEERCMVNLKCSLVTRHPSAQEGDEHTKHDCSNAFVKRRGAWVSLKCSLVTRCSVNCRGVWERSNQPQVTRGENARQED